MHISAFYFSTEITHFVQIIVTHIMLIIIIIIIMLISMTWQKNPNFNTFKLFILLVKL